jgi:hypothetical protein
MRLKDESSWTRFKRGISHDFQRGVHQLSPAGARALQWLGEAGKGRLTRLRAISWHAFPFPPKVVLLLIGTGLLLLIIILKVPQGTGLGPVLGAGVGAGMAYLFTRSQRLDEEQRRRRALATILLSEIQVLYYTLKDIHQAFFLKALHKVMIEPFHTAMYDQAGSDRLLFQPETTHVLARFYALTHILRTELKEFRDLPVEHRIGRDDHALLVRTQYTAEHIQEAMRRLSAEGGVWPVDYPKRIYHMYSEVPEDFIFPPFPTEQ